MSVCRRVAYAALMGRDNGRGGAAGQPPRAAFPKRFVESFAGLTAPNESNASGGLESALQQGFDALFEFLEALFALDHLAVDEKGRRRIHLQHLGGEFLVGRDLVEQRLVL